MYKVSIVGIDNTGKTSVTNTVGEWGKDLGIFTIYLSSPYRHSSPIARMLGIGFDKLTQYGEGINSTTVTALGYLSYLLPYMIEERKLGNSRILVSDRDPIIDTVCHAQVYLQSSLGMTYLKKTLERLFTHPDLLIYLMASPEIAIKRPVARRHIHYTIRHLAKLCAAYNTEMDLAERSSVKVLRINTNDTPLDKVILDIESSLEKILS